MKKLISIALIALMLTLPALADVAAEPEEAILANSAVGSALAVTAGSGVLIEQTTGKILYEKNSHDKIAPASITKIMTLLLFFEALEENKFQLSDEVVASEHACGMGGSQIWLEIGERMTVEDLLKATIIKSANDAAVALAELVSGSEEVFVTRMNERAKELNMADTHFENASGLDANGHLSSAYDVAVMSRELLKHSLVLQYSTVWMDSLRGGKTELTNTNKLVRFYDGCTGLKTGTTSEAGYCLSASATRGGLSLISVVMNAENSDNRFNDAKKLLDYGFANFAFVTPQLPEIAEVKIKHGTVTKLLPQVSSVPGLTVLKGREKDIELKIELLETADAPIEEGQTLGSLVWTLDGEEVASAPMLSPMAVEKLTFGKAFLRLIAAIFGK